MRPCQALYGQVPGILGKSESAATTGQSPEADGVGQGGKITKADNKAAGPAGLPAPGEPPCPRHRPARPW